MNIKQSVTPQHDILVEFRVSQAEADLLITRRRQILNHWNFNRGDIRENLLNKAALLIYQIEEIDKYRRNNQ